MPVSPMDFARPFFWAFLTLAILLLAPIACARLRKGTITLANLAFIAWIGGWRAAATALVYCLLLWSLVRLAGRVSPSVRILAIAAPTASILFLFIVLKRVDLLLPVFPAPILATARGILMAFGFSYSALRGLELLRAGWDGLAPDLQPLDAINYLIPFHMLAAGPIQSWGEFQRSPAVPGPLDLPGALAGLERIAAGMFKKYVLAHILEATLLTGFRAPWPYTLLEVQVFCIWVYLDFSAYSDIAVGAGILLGIPTPENFNNPLAARNIIQYWERWHISLSQFLRRNVFIPIQLTLVRRTAGRAPLAAATVAFAVTFTICGLWHRINLRFLCWGALHAFALVVCNLYRQWLTTRLGRKGVLRYLERPMFRILGMVTTFEFVAWSLAVIAHPALHFLDLP